MPRLFVALPLPPDLEKRIGGLAEGWPAALSAAVRRVKPENLHITLRFLGEVNPGAVARLIPALGRVADDAAACPLVLGGFRAFPNWREARSLVIGVEDIDGRVAALKERLDRELASLGFPQEGRPFRPHITVGRSRLPVRAEPPPPPPALRLYAKEFRLYESELRPEGAYYRVLEAYPLSAGR